MWVSCQACVGLHDGSAQRTHVVVRRCLAHPVAGIDVWGIPGIVDKEVVRQRGLPGCQKKNQGHY